jgi:hypothetical protein
MKKTVSARALLLSSCLVALSSGWACSSSSGTAATDAGQDHTQTQTQDTGSSLLCPARRDLEVAAPACNTFVNSATAIPFTAETGAAPNPAGGAILDGLYESTRTGAYGSTIGGGRRITFVISEGATRMLWAGEVLDMNGAAVTTTFRADTTITVSGTSINFALNCMSGAASPIPAALDFTVSGQSLILSLPNGSAVAATTYTRRGCAP